MRKLALLPESSSYAVEDGTEVIRTALDGGAGKYRRDFIGATSQVSVVFNCVNPTQYRYLRAFFNTGVSKGSEPFLCDLTLDDATEYTEHTCYFVPGSMKLSGPQGWLYPVSATFEVEPIEADADVDNDILDLYEDYGDQTNDVLFDISQFANVTMPNTLGTVGE